MVVYSQPDESTGGPPKIGGEVCWVGSKKSSDTKSGGPGEKFGSGPTSQKWPKFVRTNAKNPKEIQKKFQATVRAKRRAWRRT